MLNIILLNPNWRLHNLPETTVLIEEKMIPLDFLYMAAKIRQFANVKIVDAFLDDLSLMELVRIARDFNAQWIVTTTAVSYALWRTPPLDICVLAKTITTLKRWLKCKYLIIGPHGTTSPQYVFKKTNADIVYRGEPEYFVPMFFEHYGKDYAVPGICTEKNIVPAAPELELDVLPCPAYDLIEIDRYPPWCNTVGLEERVRALQGTSVLLEYSRGCVYHCLYCARFGFRDRYRRKSLKQIFTELDYVASLGAKYVFFIDETFNMTEDVEDSLLEKISSLGLKFGCNLRIDLMTEERIKKYIKHGCINLGYGVDSLDIRLINKVNKYSDFRRAAHILNLSKKIAPEETIAGNLNWFTPEYAEILQIGNVPKNQWTSVREIRPYPGSILGDALIGDVNDEDRWDYALKYMWWILLANKYLGNSKFRKKLKQIYIHLPMILCQIIARLLITKRYT